MASGSTALELAAARWRDLPDNRRRFDLDGDVLAVCAVRGLITAASAEREIAPLDVAGLESIAMRLALAMEATASPSRSPLTANVESILTAIEEWETEIRAGREVAGLASTLLSLRCEP